MKEYKNIIIDGRDIVTRVDGAELTGEDLKRFDTVSDDHFIDNVAEIEVISIRKGTQLPDGYGKMQLRDLYARIDTDSMPEFRAEALVNWRKTTRFCGTCGSKLNDSDNLTAKICPECGNLIFPRISPCIIIVIEKDDKILLARHVQRNQDIYACVAGFIEAGESVEQSIEREVFEETGIHIRDIKYRCSQSWPFPDQLMLGFTASYESGEITLQPDEIADAQWFDRNNLPASPKPGSVAYKLIHQLW